MINQWMRCGTQCSIQIHWQDNNQQLETNGKRVNLEIVYWQAVDKMEHEYDFGVYVNSNSDNMNRMSGLSICKSNNKSRQMGFLTGNC